MKCYNKECPSNNILYFQNCRKYIEKIEGRSSFIGEDKEMTDKMKMTEEELNDVLYGVDLNDAYKKLIINEFIEKGYIKKSNLEIAKDNYDQWLNYYSGLDISIQEPNTYIVKLRKEIERLKK